MPPDLNSISDWSHGVQTVKLLIASPLFTYRFGSYFFLSLRHSLLPFSANNNAKTKRWSTSFLFVSQRFFSSPPLPYWNMAPSVLTPMDDTIGTDRRTESAFSSSFYQLLLLFIAYSRLFLRHIWFQPHWLKSIELYRSWPLSLKRFRVISFVAS